MDTEKDLDFYLSTKFKHFNSKAQNLYFSFTGNSKPLTDKTFVEFIDPLYVVYNHIMHDFRKPFSCINEVKRLTDDSRFDPNEKILFIDLLISILSNHPEFEKFDLAFLLIVDYRNKIEPYASDEELMKVLKKRYSFDVDMINETIHNTYNPNEKLVYLKHQQFDFNSKSFHFTDEEVDYYKHIGFLHFLSVEIERAKFEIEHFQPENSTAYSSKFKLVKNKKIDFIKILSAMYDNQMFETEDGYLASNKQEVFNEFGKLLNADFSSYSTNLSQSKVTNKDSFMKPFKEIERKAEAYYEKEKENNQCGQV